MTYVASILFSAPAAGCEGQRPRTAGRRLQAEELQAEALEQAPKVSLDDTAYLIPEKAMTDVDTTRGVQEHGSKPTEAWLTAAAGSLATQSVAPVQALEVGLTARRPW